MQQNHVAAAPALTRSSSSSSSQQGRYWLNHFLSLRGHELFCVVDEDYVVDRFNLTGLPADVEHYSQAYEIITDSWDDDGEDEDDPFREELEISARHLYGLIHQRFIITTRGLQKMYEKYKRCEFGRCPRALCHGAPVLPVGLFDIPGQATVKVYCPNCEDIYNPMSTRHGQLDGAYWGTSFPHILLQAFTAAAPTRKAMPPLPALPAGDAATSANGRLPAPSQLPSSFTIERYVPKIFGFRVHEHAEWMRKQYHVQQQLLSDRQRFSAPSPLSAATAPAAQPRAAATAAATASLPATPTTAVSMVDAAPVTAESAL
ncbi:casein kinase 2 regulatory subunit [Sorochytrium milnesiophthora]